MPTIAFLPWATVTGALRFGAFHIVPFGEALARGDIPHDHVDQLESILIAYGKKRPIDRAGVPVIHHDRLSVVADLSDGEVGEYFAFRTRLAFASLAARRFFGFRYWNADNLRVVIQAYVPGGSGGVAVQSRRRDGHTRNLISKSAFTEPRPHHVSGWCELPRDLDAPLLEALERAAEGELPTWPQMGDAIRLFVGANTDNSDVDLHSELIDLVSAFSRLFDVWKDHDTVDAFVGKLPAPVLHDEGVPLGPKATTPYVIKAINKGHSIRQAWLADAYRLRGSYGHGDITTPAYPATWQTHEHLLIGAVVFPLVVKAVLERQGLYTMTPDDHATNDMIDTLMTFDAFAPDPHPRSVLEDEIDETPEPGSPWPRVISDFEMKRTARALADEFDRTIGFGEPVGDKGDPDTDTTPDE